MPAPRSVARFNNHVTNRILGPVVEFLPGFGKIEHVGRRSGRQYRSPMMAFRSGDLQRVTFALTYGPGAEWVRNALAAGEVIFVSRWSGRLRLVDLAVVHDPQRRAMPGAIRRVLGLMRVDDFLVARVAAEG